MKSYVEQVQPLGGLVSVTPLVTLTAIHGLLGERVVVLVTHLLNHGRQQLQGEGGGGGGGRVGGWESGKGERGS